MDIFIKFQYIRKFIAEDLQNNRIISIFAESNNKQQKRNMKSSELNRLILRNGWKVVSQRGSHVKY
jgi:hypothetical protein